MARRNRPDQLTHQEPDDEHVGPSAAWGWHDAFPRTIKVMGVLTALVFVALMFTQDTQQSTQPRLWLGGAALLVVIGALAYRTRRQRRERTFRR